METTVDIKKLVGDDNSKLNVFYVTDPLCSYCFAAEPQINRFRLEYGEYINFRTVMGGLLKNWDTTNPDKSNETKMMNHWKEVAHAFRMPIDGSVWLNDTCTSSYIPSRVYTVLEEINPQIADVFLRRIREELFINNKNIARRHVLMDVLVGIAIDFCKSEDDNDNIKCGIDCKNGAFGDLSPLDIIKLAIKKKSYQDLHQHFAIRRALGVKSFPALVIMSGDGKSLLISGKSDYEQYDYAIKEMFDENNNLLNSCETEENKENECACRTVVLDRIKNQFMQIIPQNPPALDDLLGVGNYLFAVELEEIYALEKNQVKDFIDENLTNNDYKVEEIMGEIAIVQKPSIVKFDTSKYDIKNIEDIGDFEW